MGQTKINYQHTITLTKRNEGNYDLYLTLVIDLKRNDEITTFEELLPFLNENENYKVNGVANVSIPKVALMSVASENTSEAQNEEESHKLITQIKKVNNALVLTLEEPKASSGISLMAAKSANEIVTLNSVSLLSDSVNDKIVTLSGLEEFYNQMKSHPQFTITKNGTTLNIKKNW